jgi:nucleoside-diphosphate-sugar epimerase
MQKEHIIDKNETILVTGAGGFIGARVVHTLLDQGFENIVCLARSDPTSGELGALVSRGGSKVTVLQKNLLSREDCASAVQSAAVIYHLAASTDKSFAGSFLGTVVPTRNLVEAALATGRLKRFVNVSSFAVYSNWNLPRRAVLDESCPIETVPHLRQEAYCFAKAKQEELVREYEKQQHLPLVIIRPGAVYGPRAGQFLTSRIGIDTFGIFLHLGGGNRVPLSYVDNCAEGIVLAGLVAGINGEVFNLVDDDLPKSRTFLRLYKKHARSFRSISVPYPIFYLFSYLWERYSVSSAGQFAPVFNRLRCAAYWKGNRFRRPPCNIFSISKRSEKQSNESWNHWLRQNIGRTRLSNTVDRGSGDCRRLRP